MSAIASFVLLPIDALEDLRAVATSLSRFGSVGDTYHDYLTQRGREVGNYNWSGYFIGTLFPYLNEKHGIDLRSSDPELSMFLTKARGATHIIFNDDHRKSHLDRLKTVEFSEATLCTYWNEFNGANDSDAGKPMLDGIHAIQRSLAAIDESHIVVLGIG